MESIKKIKTNAGEYKGKEFLFTMGIIMHVPPKTKNND
jgi:hypothetical protein